MSIQKAYIKCGNAKLGAWLLDDIKNRLNERRLDGSIYRIHEITTDNQTWITALVDFNHPRTESQIECDLAYVQGMITGVLVWSGVDVI